MLQGEEGEAGTDKECGEGRRFGYVLQKETGTPETVQAMDNLFANAHTSRSLPS